MTKIELTEEALDHIDKCVVLIIIDADLDGVNEKFTKVDLTAKARFVKNTIFATKQLIIESAKKFAENTSGPVKQAQTILKNKPPQAEYQRTSSVTAATEIVRAIEKISGREFNEPTKENRIKLFALTIERHCDVS